MSVYIVRWNNPNPAICLVKAPNKTEVMRLMDGIWADPSFCKINEYRGPLVINIDLDIKSHQEEVENSCVPHTVVDDISKCLDDPGMIISIDVETNLDIIEKVFPKYNEYFDQRVEDLGHPGTAIEEARAESACKKAIQQDFDDIEKQIRSKLETSQKRIIQKSVLEEAEDILQQSEES